MAKRKAISTHTREDLEVLKRTGILTGFYLGGGTGLAFVFAHRESLDLDFFSESAFDESRLVERLRDAGSFSLEKKEVGTVYGTFRDTRVSFFHYPYPLLEEPRVEDGVSIASPRDIACMKLDAISTRGTKRDFIDLYTIIHEARLPLAELLMSFSKKYTSLKYNLMHVKKSLVYFADAESDPMPKMLKPLGWDTVKKFFIAEIKKVT